MRMWGVDPTLLCRNHLLGEHRELHCLIGNLTRKRSIYGYVKNGLVDPSEIVTRHEAIAEEMLRREYNHKSPLPKEFIHRSIRYKKYPLNIDENLIELSRRCEKCRDRIARIKETL